MTTTGDAELDKALPAVVYHYTSMDTLLKIVEKGQIWATNIRYLNDVSERQHFLGLLRKRIPELLPEDSTLKAEWFDSEASMDVPNHNFFSLPFVSSFSEDGDSLTQWRSYCPNGNGVCIGFRTEYLVDATVGPPKEKLPEWHHPPTVDFERVEYLDRNNTSNLDALIKHALDKARKFDSSNQSQDDPILVTVGDYFWILSEQQASQVKDSAFSSEKEWRLLVQPRFDLGSVQYRSSRSTLVPYLVVDLPNPLQADSLPTKRRFAAKRPHFIESVRVGPTPHLELSAGSLRGLFRGKNLDVMVHLSSVPFRDW